MSRAVIIKKLLIVLQIVDSLIHVGIYPPTCERHFFKYGIYSIFIQKIPGQTIQAKQKFSEQEKKHIK
jgi:hypothetical protein